MKAILARASHAIDEISKDYGEDLLVQTSHAGRMDASRLWFQVRGTANVERYRLRRPSPGKLFRLSVPFASAMRWMRTVDMVVVVLWDVERETGWYALPKRQVDDWRGVISGQRYVSLSFAESSLEALPPLTTDLLTPRTAARLAWESRINHFCNLVLCSALVADEKGPDPTKGAKARRLTLILQEFLGLLDIIEPSGSEPGEIVVTAGWRARALEIYDALLAGDLIGDMPTDPPAQLVAVAEQVIAERLRAIDVMLHIPRAPLGHAAYALAFALGLGRYLDRTARPRLSSAESGMPHT
ncbi:MAG TPA: hypothetical protein VF731_05610 [Solirubrobacterales bacterium]